MNSLIAVILTTVLFVISGWYLTYLIPSLEKIERLGLSFLLGAGITTFLWFLLYLAGLPFNLTTLTLASLIEISLGYQLARHLKLKPIPSHQVKLTRVHLILISGVVLSLLIAFLIGTHNPLTAWDSIALYDFRGHAIALNHDLRDITDSSYYVSYPLMVSLVHAVVYMLGGVSAQGIHALILTAFIAVVYGRMKTWTNLTYALVTCILIIGQNEIFAHATYAYTNLPYLAYLVTGIIYAVSATKKDVYFLPFAGILIGLSTWVRTSETFWVIGMILILVQGWLTKHRYMGIISAIMVLMFRFTWTTYLNQVLVSINYSYEETVRSFRYKNVLRIISNWPEIYWYMRLNIFSPYLGIWLLTIPTAMTAMIKKDTKSILLFGTIFLSTCMLVLGIMVFSTFYTTWNQIGDSARRMILFMIPLTIITAVYSTYVISRKEKHE